MKIHKDLLIGSGFVIIFGVLVFVSKLFQNKAGERWSVDTIFTSENALDTLKGFIIPIAILVIYYLFKNLYLYIKNDD